MLGSEAPAAMACTQTRRIEACLVCAGPEILHIEPDLRRPGRDFMRQVAPTLLV